MTMKEKQMDFRKAVEACKTKAELMKVLARYGKRIVKDDTKDVGCFSIWVDDATRIYQMKRGQTMKFQTWKKIEMNYSGVPVFFG